MKRSTCLLVLVAACAAPPAAPQVTEPPVEETVEQPATAEEEVPAAATSMQPADAPAAGGSESGHTTASAPPEPREIDVPPTPREPATPDERVPPSAELTAEITADQFLARAAHLASDAFEGRESGTASGVATEEYVAGELRRMGFEFLGKDGEESPFLEVRMPMRTPLPHLSGIEIATADGWGERIASPPFAFGKPGTAEGDVVFVGYGLSDEAHGYDDYAGIDVTGKVVIVVRHGPREADEKSPWFRRGPGARAMAFTAKAMLAQRQGAAAVLLVNDARHRGEFLPVSIPGRQMGIPVVNVTRKTVDALLAPSGKTVEGIQDAIDTDLKPRSFALDGVRVRVTGTLGDAKSRNVVAVKRGSDPELSREAVLLCAHMDHVGHGWFGSPSGPGSIHNGADDNASGTAAVLEAAEALSAAPPTKRSILVALWCGEEKGLVGSTIFTRDPAWELERITTCVNLDMVGRYQDDGEDTIGLNVGGASTGSGLEERVLRIGAAHGLKISQSWMAWNQSDHAPFYRAGVPALFLNTGLHSDYHRPGDDWWKLQAEPAARIAQFARDMVVELANAPERPVYKKKPPRPVLGVRLADAPNKAGAVIIQVFPRFGAARAGLQANDVIVAFGGEPVTSTRDLTELIGRTKPDDEVEIRYLRAGGEAVATVKITGM
jgi:hypothetical protein